MSIEKRHRNDEHRETEMKTIKKAQSFFDNKIKNLETSKKRKEDKPVTNTLLPYVKNTTDIIINILSYLYSTLIGRLVTSVKIQISL